MARPGKLRVYPDVNGNWRWQLCGGNGEILASGQGHRDMRDAKRAARTFRLIAATAIVVEGTN